MADAQPIKIGPFTGGMNTYSDPTAIADTEAVLIQNYDVDIDGSLTSRPPMTAFTTDTKYTDAVSLGTYRHTNGTNYLIFSVAGTGFGTYAYNMTAGGPPVTITTTIAASSCVQYDNKLWLTAPVGATGNGGGWDGSVFTAVPTMPKGNCCCMYKERMFIGQGAAGASAIYFCWPLGDVTSGHGGGGPGGTWDTTANLIYINKGDGQPLTIIRTFNNVIVCFKSNSTYIFAYDTAPTRGTVQMVSATVGLRWQYCSVEYENSLFVVSGDSVYQISNWNFDLINIKTQFTYANTVPATVQDRQPVSASVVGNRLFVRYWDSTYVYNLKTRAWTIWTSANEPARWIRDPIMNAALGVDVYYALSYRKNVTYLLRLYDGMITGASEPSFVTKILTKTYNVEVPYTYKRLFWWGVDCYSKVDINAKVSPTVYARPVTWQSLIDDNLKWNQLGTWARLKEVNIDVTDSATMTSIGNTRTFVKYWKSLRFRQIQFQLDSALTGDTTDSPQRIYTLTAVIGNKQVVVAKVN